LATHGDSAAELVEGAIAGGLGLQERIAGGEGFGDLFVFEVQPHEPEVAMPSVELREFASVGVGLGATATDNKRGLLVILHERETGADVA
jgi:hypothetical protein